MNNPLEWLKDTNWYVRWTAAQALGESGDEAVIDVLVKVAEDAEEDFRVRSRAIKSIGEIGGQRAVEALLEIKERLGYSWDDEIFEALVLLGKLAVRPLVEILKRSAKTAAGAGRAAKALGKMGNLAVDAIAELLNDDDGGIREWTMVALGNTRSERAKAVIWSAVCREKDREVIKAGERAVVKINKALKRKGESK